MTNRTKRERIGVLAGGPSSEREISLLSGSAVHGALISAGCDAVLIDVTGSEHVRDEVRAAGIDIAFIALHGRFGEDGSVQTVLEEMGIPYTGSGPEASKRALDKIVSREIFAQNRIAIPRGFLLRRQETAAGVGELETAGFSLPLVVKPPLEGSSIGVSIVSAASDFAAAAAEAFRYSDTIIIEEYIKGRELTVGILGERPLPVIEIGVDKEFYDFKAKYISDTTRYILPARISAMETLEAQRVALAAHRALGCRSFSRVDMILSEKDRQMIVLEVNSIPGFTSHSLLPKAAAAAGINFADLCRQLIDFARNPQGARGPGGESVTLAGAV